MFFIVVLSITFAVSAADPLGCCLPSRWSGLLQQVGGSLYKNNSVSQGVAVDDYLWIEYDYTKRMQAVVSHQLDMNTGKRANTTIIYDYKNGRLHILKDGQCHTDPLDPTSMFDPCMIKTFSYGDSYTVGSSLNKLQINTFDGMLGKLWFSIAVTARDCTPVADKLYGEDDTAASVYAFVFMNISTTDVHDSMFQTPTGCNAGIINTGVGKRDLEALNLQRRPFSL